MLYYMTFNISTRLRFDWIKGSNKFD
uniref:Uncharacterized protein n=1 Tax=Tetranychus urticae TaxID=32264 RepID=T1K3P9_TETUR